MHTQDVRPAGVGHEALWVLLAVVLVLMAAAITIGVRVQPGATAALAPHELDARTQLNAAEQGLHADLLVAADEIAALAEGGQALPPVQHLAGIALPPFSPGPDAAARGGHEWRALVRGPANAYVGRSSAPEVAASFLLRLPVAHSAGHDHADGAAVWLHRAPLAAWPEQLDEAALVRQGWRRVITRYDAGVTRRDAH